MTLRIFAFTFLRRKRAGVQCALLALMSAMVALAGCGSGSSGAAAPPAVTACLNAADTTPEADLPNQSDARITIINKDTTLDSLISCSNAPVPIDGYGVASAGGAAPLKAGKNFSLTLAAEVAPPSIVGTAVFVGAGLNDATAGGTYSGTALTPPYVRYRVEIDAAGTPDTFRWSLDDGATWVQQNVAVTGGAQSLSDGVQITFTATTGHTVGDRWMIDAGILQATSVSVLSDLAVVGYAMAGPPYLGAIQVYRLKQNSAQLKSMALIRDTDIHAVHLSGSSVYTAGAHEPVLKPSVVERFALSGSNLAIDTGPVELSSFAATSILHDTARGQVYVTDGDDNGLVVLDEALQSPVSFALEDARWVALEGNLLAVAQGCCGPNPQANGQVTTYDVSGGSPASPNVWGFTGADVDDSKTTVQLLGGKAFLAAGSGGALVLDPSDGTVLAAVPNPTGTGLADNLVVANAASADEDLLFISNGEAGVYVAQEDNNDFLLTGNTASLTLLGHLQFDSLQSVNHVAYFNRYLIVAAGLGGTKVVRINVP